MYLTSLHNTHICLDRSANKGVFTAKYESADELADVPVELRPPIDDAVYEADVPSILNFLPLDALHGVMDQDPPARSGIYAAFPLQPDWQQMHEMVCSTSKDMAAAPSPAMSHKDMSFWHNCATDLVASGKQQVIYTYMVRLARERPKLLCIYVNFLKVRCKLELEQVKQHPSLMVQPHIGWAHNEYNQAVMRATEAIKLPRLRLFYENTTFSSLMRLMLRWQQNLNILIEPCTKSLIQVGNLKTEIGMWNLLVEKP